MANKKKDDDKFEHWKACVETYFTFCRDNFNGESPSFDGSSPRDLKTILTQLRKRAEEKKIGWSENVAKDRLLKFLQFAFNDAWLKRNWTLSNINKKKDALFFNAASGGSDKINKSKNQEIISKLPPTSVYDFMD